MATISEYRTKCGRRTWHVRIRLKGCTHIHASFSRRTEAHEWASVVEDHLRRERICSRTKVIFQINRY